MDVQSKKVPVLLKRLIDFSHFLLIYKEDSDHIRRNSLNGQHSVRFSVNMMSLCVFVGALQYTGSQGGNIQAAS